MVIFRNLVWAVLQPGNLLMLCLLAGVILHLLTRGRRGKVLVGLSALGFALLAVVPIGPAMMLPLEERFPRPAKLPERIDGILVLGGAVTPPFSWSSGVTAFNCSTVRVLITSAYHMPRSMGAFTAVGWQVIPYPVDFSIDRQTELRASFNLVDGLHDSTLAGHEWVGLVGYRLMGWTRELFP